LNLVVSLFKPQSRLAAENAALRQQLIVLQRKVPGRVQFTNRDRLFFIQLYRRCPSILKAMMIMRPETLVRWHRVGLRRYWRWKSRPAGGRPPIHPELRALIWRMSVDNRLWGRSEDNDDNVYMFKNRPTRAGFTVVVATDGAQGRPPSSPTSFSWTSPCPDIDGEEATRRIKADPAIKRIPIIASNPLASRQLRR
jgi:hypothetical protein